ncbi:MAG: ATP-binding protein, partial [Candidatus Rokuibacteriota bacterium]
MTARILAVRLRYEHDVVAARQRAREVAGALGFDAQEQTRIATALSEIARNAFSYAGGGTVEFLVEGRTPPQILVIQVSDEGPGIADLEGILGGRYRSRSGLGLGIVGARRLMDRFHVESAPGLGTTVTLKKLLPAGAPVLDSRQLVRTVDELARRQPHTPFGELQQQNQELLRTLEELRERQEELGRLNAELEDTNRGVVALYAELDEKADHLRRADEMKSRFLSNMSHEFRTPLNSVLALTRLILGRAGGPLTAEQEKQVAFIRKAAEDLSELVNDLLDLAKVEAGKIVVRPVEFEVGGLFGALRGMLRPLLVNESVSLVFEEADGIPPLYSDEGKISQILRNFISNALKFTEQGEVRVSAAPERESVVFSVADTGIGIAPEDQERIFQEFAQVDNPVQRTVRGTGLGLPLSRRLAELLGGRLTVESRPGVGSTFSATIPRVYAPAPPTPAVLAPDWRPDAARRPVLVVENSAETLLLYEKYLKRSPYEVVPVRRVRDARQLLRRVRPAAVLLDILLDGEDAWTFLAELKRDDATRAIPVVVVTTDVNLPDISGFEVCRRIKSDPGTASVLVLHLSATSVREGDRVRGLEFGADNYLIEPIHPDELIANVHALLRMRRAEQVARAAAEEAERRRREADVLTDLIRSINTTLALDGVLQQVARAAMLLCGSDGARIALRDAATGGMAVFYRLDADGRRPDAPPVVIEPGRGVGGQVLATGRPFRTADYAADPRITKDYLDGVRREGVVAALAVPITLGPDLQGVLYVVNRTARPFTDRDEEVLQRLADHAAIAIRNSELFAREQAARAEAEAANRAKDEFLATVSHELRTPLMAMVGWVQLLRAAPLDEAMRARALETISRNARIQTQLVDDLLDVSRIISGKLRLEPRPVDLAAVVAAAVDAVRPAAHAKGIALDTAVDGQVGAVAGDADRLQQVVWNLLSNAVKFTPAGGRVTVILSRRDGEAEVRVADTGQGIDPAFLPYVFERFRQADTTSVRRHGGLGLGLAIVRHLVELHGGQVRVDSPGDGQGSTFSVPLPVPRPKPGVTGHPGPAAPPAPVTAAPTVAGT